jgi:hypothetical protein
MARTMFIVRAEVAEADRAAFDRWYGTHHLPMAMDRFRAARGWRGWSKTEKGVHYAFYEFADAAQLDAILNGPVIKELVADFDAGWGAKVKRTHEVVEIAA